MVACWKTGASKPRKSAPTRLKESPKYIHWPSRESRRPPTPAFRSRSNVERNWDTWQQKIGNVLECSSVYSSSPLERLPHPPPFQTSISESNTFSKLQWMFLLLFAISWMHFNMVSLTGDQYRSPQKAQQFSMGDGLSWEEYLVYKQWAHNKNNSLEWWVVS